MVIAAIFPGQGSQKVGMGQDLAGHSPAARAVFAQADAALGWEVSALCFAGPETELKKTENAQPALLATSIACWEAAREGGLQPSLLAGHSLGEYSALVAAGAIDLGDALRLVRRRGELMAQATDGRMAAVVGLDRAAVEAACERAAETGVCVPVNYNSPTQIVISGEPDAVDLASRHAKEAGARTVIPLPVSGAFHSPLMAVAAARFAADLDRVEFRDPRVPTVTNVSGRIMRTAAEVRAALRAQMAAPVRWEEAVRAMTSAGATTFVEVGPGRILGGLVRQIAPEAIRVNVEDTASLAAMLAAVGAKE